MTAARHTGNSSIGMQVTLDFPKGFAEKISQSAGQQKAALICAAAELC